MRGNEWWDRWFIGLAKYVASASKDPSTQTGAVIVRPNRSVASMGFNGFPQGMRDDDGLYADRSVKYSRIVHCEINALIFASESVRGYTLYTWPFLSCDRCAVVMIQAGITRLVAPPTPIEKRAAWQEAFDRTTAYCKEAGVAVAFVDLAP